MKLRRAIPAGLVDSGLASLATFVINLYAIATWESDSPETLGVYFLYLTAFLMASTVPNQLIFVPAEKMTLEVAQPARLLFFGKIARLGLPVSTASASLILLATMVGASQGLTFADQVPFLVTAAVATVFSPLQNHTRRLLHLAGRSWLAASVSMVQVAVAALSLLLLANSSVAAEWVPTGALATANIASVTAAALFARWAGSKLSNDALARVGTTREQMGYGSLSPAGRWLVATGLVSLGNNFAVESAVFALASPEALALAGAAKTVAQPILVMANGLRSVLGPPSMEAARARNRKDARRVARTFNIIIGGGVAGYIAFAGFAWVGNPLARLVESAYTVPLLVPLSIAANGLNGAAFPGRLELIGADREKQLFTADLRANIAQLVCAVPLAALAGGSARSGAFARPVAFAVLGIGRLIGFRTQLDRYYSEPPATSGPPTTISQSPDSLPPPV